MVILSRRDRPPPVPAAEAARVRAAVLRARRMRRAAVGRRLRLYAAVGLGSVIGGSLRWLASEALRAALGPDFPWGTLCVNVSGSFLIGFYAAMAGPDGRLLAGPVQRQFVMTGFCGGFTTFSIFSLDTVLLVEAGDIRTAAAFVGASLALWFAAVWAGFGFATRFNRLRR